MKNNIITYDKTKSLTTSLIKSSKYPLFISIDEEGFANKLYSIITGGYEYGD